MRKIFCFLILIILFACNNTSEDKKNKTNIPIDSLTIFDDEFALNPFPEKVNFNYFLKHINVEYKFSKEMEAYLSENIDTFKVLKWGNSYVKALLKEDENDFFLVQLVISDSNFILNNNIKIGQTAESIFKKFNYKIDKNKYYKFLQVENKEAACNLFYFNFTNNILTSFEYYPYTG